LRALQREFPRVKTQGLEVSEYLCGKYGWTHGSVVDFEPVRPADLVVCQDVLGYLDEVDCARALTNLADMSNQALCLGVLTTEDLTLCDPERTDAAQLDRPRNWYQRRLQCHFVNAGGGVFLKRPLEVTLWSLDRL